MNLKDTYNKIARLWHDDHAEDDWWIEGTETFASLLSPGSTVLDVGCGSGMKSKFLIDKGFLVVGFDFSEKMIEIARETAPKGEFHVLDFREAHTLNRKFDAVFAQAALLHASREEVGDIISSLGKLLVSGGYFYIAVKDKTGHSSWEEVRKENDYGFEYERFFSYFSPDEIENYLKNEGFKIVYSHIWKNKFGKSGWVQVIGQKP